MRSAKQYLFGSLGAALVLSGLSVLSPSPAQAASTGLIINEVYGGGGSTSASASYKSDFVELLNRLGEPQPLKGLSLQYRSGTYNGTGTVSVLALPDVMVPAGSKYLVQVSNPNGCSGNPCGGADLSAPDHTGTTLNMSGTGGHVILAQGVSGITATGNSMHTVSNVVDFVGYGTTPTSSETAPTGVALSTTLSTQRKTATDGDNNSTDFAAPTTPSPEGMGAVVQPLAATDPGDKVFNQDQAITPITLAATGGASPYTWAVTGGTLPDGLSLADNQITGTPTAVTPSPVEITVTATDSASPTPATATATFTITVQEALAVTPIAELQGTGARSQFAPETGNGNGSRVLATEGVVTAAYPVGGFNGLYLQTPGADTADASDGIFVYGGSDNVNIPAGIKVGDSVRVTGRIAEFFDLTQIVPGAGGVTELESSLGEITPRSIAYPTTAEAREAREGELLAPTDSLTVTNAYSTNQYGEVGLATGSTPLKQPTEFVDDDDTAGLEAIDAENLARGVVLDDGATTNYLQNQTTKALPVPYLTAANGSANPNPPRVGAGATLQAPVVLDWRNNVWKLQPRTQVTVNGADVVTFEADRAANLAPAPVGGDVKIATFNVLNYFNTTGEAYSAAGPQQSPPLDTFCTYYTDRGLPGVSGSSKRISNNSCGVRQLDNPDTATDESTSNDGRGPRGAATDVSLARQEAKLASTLVAMDADVIGLEEVENSIKLPGETNRDDAVARIVEILNEREGAGTWKYVRSPGEATTASAVAEQDVIRPAFIYKPAALTPVGQSDILFGTTEFTNAREPLAQAFKKAGGLDSDAFAVIVNHFKSKGDSCSSFDPPSLCQSGDNKNSPYYGAFNGDRVRQATRLAQFAEDFAEERGIQAVFLAGDFNAYSKEDPIHVLEASGYDAVESDTAGEESYSFSGYSGSLDHVLGNEAAMDMVTGADIWEINANEAISFQYSRFNNNVTDFWQPNLPFGTSDHNPEIVGLDLPDGTQPEYDEIQVLGTNDFHGRLLPDGGNAAGAAPFATAVEELRAENPNTIFVAAGDLVGASTFESFIQDDEPTIDALNAMGLEVSAAGNHEFDRGYEDFVGRIQDRAAWEYIAANVTEPQGEPDRLAESWTKTIDGKVVGFVGAVTEDLPQLVNPEGIQGVTVTDVVEAANAEAAALRGAGADLVVLLVHEGAPTTDCTSSSFTDPAGTWGNIVQNTSADVDAIISGHTHLAYNCKFAVDEWADRGVKQRPVVSAGQYGTNLNKLVFKFDGDQLAAVTQDVVATAGVGYAPDAEVKKIVDDAVAFASVKGNEVLGKMDGPFQRATYNASSKPTENRGGESTLSNQVAEVQRWATDEAGIDTDIAFMNPGGLRADMAGVANGDLRDLTYRGAADVQPFANTLVNMKLTGAQLETVLEQQWQRNAQGGVPSRPFLRLGISQGFTYTYVEEPETVTLPSTTPVKTFRGEVTGMWLDGEPVDAAQVYSVTVNSFLGTGGDNFFELANGADKVDTGQVDLEAMVEYMDRYDAQSPLEVDYSQRGVELTLPANPPATYRTGDTVAFDIGSWAMSAPGDAKDTTLQVRLGEQVLGSFPVDNTIGNTPYDGSGTASVSFELPATVPDGVVELTVFGPTTKTSVPLLIAVDDVRQIQILGTNDFHGRLLPNAGSREPGAAVLSGAVKQLREDNPNTIFAAAGDLIGASTFESFIQRDKPTIDALNAAGLDVSAVGNHELDQGYEDLVDRVMVSHPEGGARWKYIAANLKIKATGDDAVPATWIKTIDGVDIGFVGAVTEELPALVSPSGIQELEVTKIVDSVNTEAADLKAAGAEVVVMLVHEGSASTSCTSPQFTDESTAWGNITQNVSADVDAIVSGHTHLAYNCSFPVAEWVAADRPVTERPVVSAGQYAMNLNQLLLEVDESGVVGLESKILPLMTTDPDGGGPALPAPLYPADPAVQSIVSAAESKASVLGAAQLGRIAGPFDRSRFFGFNSDNQPAVVENRGGESTLGNKVAEVQRWATQLPELGVESDIAFMNPGGLRANMQGTVDGDVRNLTYRQAANVQPFANTLVNMTLTGAQIETVLEQQWQRAGDGGLPTRPFLRLGVSDGFTYTYVERPTSVGGASTFEGEITGMWLNGEPVDAAATYSVTVNSFLASGGDNFREFANGTDRADTGQVDLQAMVEYMEQFQTERLQVDYSQRAVEVEFPQGAPASYVPGGRVTFDVASWSMLAPTDKRDTELQVKLGDTVLGTFPVVHGELPTTPYDQYGTAQVAVDLPADQAVGAAELTLVGAQTGTVVRVPVSVATGSFVNDVLPVVSGTPTVGEELAASAGEWAPAPTATSYQWLADGVEIDGATEATLTLTPAQAGKKVTVKVTVTRAGFADGVATSEPTAAVAKATPTVRVVNEVVEYGRTASVDVTVTAGGVPTAGGPVTLRIGGTVIGTGTVSSNGIARVTVAARAVKPSEDLYTMTAVYGGNAGVAGGSDTGLMKVTKGSVRMVYVVTDPIRVNSTRTAVTVKVANSYGLPPNGTVTVAATGVGSVTVTLVDGKATARLPRFTSVGTKSLVVRYNGSSVLQGLKLTDTVKVVR